MENSKQFSRSERAFNKASYLILTVVALLALLPFVLIVSASLTDETALLNYGYQLLPSKVSFVAYQYISSRSAVILRSYGLSILVTMLGTFIGLVLTTCLAYPISRKDYKHRNVLAFFVFFTMLFSGGVTPAYIMWTRYFHISNTVWALIVPNYLLNGFNVMLMRNYFSNNVPFSLIEAAKLDGAGELRVLRNVIIPLSVPVITTVGLFMGIAYWNDWINALYYVSEPKYFGIQSLLLRMMNNIQFLNSGQAANLVGSGSVALPSTGIRMAMAVIGVLPILVVYPLLQKHLVKGVVMGAVKG